MQEWGNATEEQIKKALTWGDGPILKLSYLSESHIMLGRFNGLPANDPNGFERPDAIELNFWTVEDIENKLQNGGDFEAEVYKTFIAIIILHEYTHYADFQYNGNMFNESINIEPGDEFEIEIIGEKLDYNNDGLTDAQQYLIKKEE